MANKCSMHEYIFKDVEVTSAVHIVGTIRIINVMCI